VLRQIVANSQTHVHVKAHFAHYLLGDLVVSPTVRTPPCSTHTCAHRLEKIKARKYSDLHYTYPIDPSINPLAN